MLTHPSAMLSLLDMDNTSLSSTAARTLFTTVRDTFTLKRLYINNNAISDNVTDDIARAITINKSLVKLELYGNLISREAIATILQALRSNNTLRWLLCSHS